MQDAHRLFGLNRTVQSSQTPPKSASAEMKHSAHGKPLLSAEQSLQSVPLQPVGSVVCFAVMVGGTVEGGPTPWPSAAVPCLVNTTSARNIKLVYITNLATIANLMGLGIVARHVLMEGNSTSMARGRALLTESEKESLAGEKNKQRRYEARSRFRSRVRENLKQEMEFLSEHDPELLEDLREVVCGDDGND